MAGEALKMPVPGAEERSVVRDSREEKQHLLALFRELGTQHAESMKFP